MNIGEVFKNQLLAPTKGMNLIIDRFTVASPEFGTVKISKNAVSRGGN